MSISVVLVDDDPFVGTSLSTILNAQPDVEVVACGTSGPEAEQLYRQHKPDVLLSDIQMPDGDGITAAEHILADDPQAKIVFLTTFDDDEYIVRALRLGAKGYLIKQQVADIAPALRSVMAGQSVLGTQVMGKMDALMAAGTGSGGAEADTRKPFSAPGLTERECEIVQLIAEGLDNKEIAARIFIGEGTVRNHVSAILSKLDCKNRTQLAIYYYTAE